MFIHYYEFLKFNLKVNVGSQGLSLTKVVRQKPKVTVYEAEMALPIKPKRTVEKTKWLTKREPRGKAVAVLIRKVKEKKTHAHLIKKGYMHISVDYLEVQVMKTKYTRKREMLLELRYKDKMTKQFFFVVSRKFSKRWQVLENLNRLTLSCSWGVRYRWQKSGFLEQCHSEPRRKRDACWCAPLRRSSYVEFQSGQPSRDGENLPHSVDRGNLCISTYTAHKINCIRGHDGIYNTVKKARTTQKKRELQDIRCSMLRKWKDKLTTGVESEWRPIWTN